MTGKFGLSGLHVTNPFSAGHWVEAPSYPPVILNLYVTNPFSAGHWVEGEHGE